MNEQVVLYLFTYPPLSPFLNEMFMRLDAAFPLFGTAGFALFCFYLIGAPTSHHFLVLTSLVQLSVSLLCSPAMAVLNFLQLGKLSAFLLPGWSLPGSYLIATGSTSKLSNKKAM